MEAEARSILRSALETSESASGRELVASIRRKFEPIGGVDLDLPSREIGREPPELR